MKALKLGILISLFFIVTLSAHSQISYRNTWGSGILLCNSGGPTIEFSPRVNFIELGDEFAISLGTHLAGCVYLIDGCGLYGFSAPLLSEMHFGFGSTGRSMLDFGFIAGAGYAYSMLNDFDGWKYNKAIGPYFNFGVTGYFFDIPMGIKLSFQKNTHEKYLNEGFSHAATLGIFWNIE
jgi:hypothetical protein